jgi:hypothetical protein
MARTHSLLKWTATAAVGLCIALALAVPSADAQRRLRADIFITQAQVPRGLNQRALIGFARGHQARRLAETTAEPIAQRKWLANMVVAFSGPIGDLEFHVVFYDVTGGSRSSVDDMSTYLNDRTQTTYLQRLQLARPRFRPNRRFELVVTVRHEEVGRGSFETIGEEPRRDGQVDFSEQDTRSRD